MKIRALVIERDSRLGTLLALEADIEVAARCTDGESATAILAATRPDLIFADAQLITGNRLFETAESLAAAVVLLLGNGDSCLDPGLNGQVLECMPRQFGLERLVSVLHRARQWLRARRAVPPAPCADRILVKSGSRYVFVDLDELEFLHAAANYVDLEVSASRYRVREPIGAMQARLPASQFIRVHRSYIVNIAALRTVLACGGGEYALAMHSGRQLPVGARYAAALLERMRPASFEPGEESGQAGSFHPA